MKATAAFIATLEAERSRLRVRVTALENSRDFYKEALKDLADWHSDCGCHGCRAAANILI